MSATIGMYQALSQLLHSELPEVEVISPSPQDMHCDIPREFEYFPGEQGKQPRDPAVSEAVPISHEMQVLEPSLWK